MGVTPAMLEDLTFDQIYLMACDKDELKKMFTLWETENPLAMCFGITFNADRTFFMNFQKNAIVTLAPAQFMKDFTMTLEN